MGRTVMVAGVALAGWFATASLADATVLPRWDHEAGVVTAVDHAAATVTVGARTFAADRIDLRTIEQGSEVEVWFRPGTKDLEALTVHEPVREEPLS